MVWEDLERARQAISQIVSTQKNSGDDAEEVLPQAKD